VPVLLFTCPNTNQATPTRIATDVKALSAAWKRTLKIVCPHCGQVHRTSVREAYIESALRDAVDRLDRVVVDCG
jgi:Cdc6-like AAA superfamily ATPase